MKEMERNLKSILLELGFPFIGLKNAPLKPRGGMWSVGSIEVISVSYNFQTCADTGRKNCFYRAARKARLLVRTPAPWLWARSNVILSKKLSPCTLPLALSPALTWRGASPVP